MKHTIVYTFLELLFYEIRSYFYFKTLDILPIKATAGKISK